MKSYMYRDDHDYWRIRAFLRDMFLLNKRQELSWQVARLDYWRYFGNENLEHYNLSQAICILETAEGCIAAVVTPESRGNAYFHVQPQLRSVALEAAMLELAETYLSEGDSEGQRQLTVWAHQQDGLRQKLLQEHGYHKGDWPEHQYGRSLDTVMPNPALPADYCVRSLGDTAELPARGWLSWQVFHPDEPDENYSGWHWYLDVQRCPLYRRDLDLVAVAPDGELAAFCTVWYDDVTRTGYFEPVGVSPAHQRKGLGKAIMYEGLRRVKQMGAVYATVAGFSEAAKALYASVMSPDYVLLERWRRTWPMA